MNALCAISKSTTNWQLQVWPIGTRFGGAVVATLFLFGARAVHADAITAWNAITEATVLEATVDPFLQIRSATITQLAVFEAVNAIVGDYEPYVGGITAPPGASPEAAAIAAAHHTLVALYPDNALNLDALRHTALMAIPNGQAKDDGIRVGEAAAQAILALRADDGASTDVPSTPKTRPGDWRPTPPDFTPAFRPGLDDVATFGIEHGAQFRVGPPPALHSRRYARDYSEVKAVGDVHSTERSRHRTDVARFFEVTDAVSLYNPAARQVSEAQGKTLSENARIFALLNMAIFDAAVAVFDSKYVYNFWRPVTAIRAGDTDANRKTERDPNWQPLVFYPCQRVAAGRGAPLHELGTDHRRRRRRADLWRCPLPLRYGGRCPPRPTSWRVHSAPYAAPRACLR